MLLALLLMLSISIRTMNCLVFYFMLFLVLKGTKGLDEKCTKNSECSSTIHSLCIDGECKCDDLSYYNGTQCLQFATEYNAICDEETQCGEWMGDSAVCKNNRCVCVDNYRWYKGQCQKYVDKGNECNSDDECYNGYDLLSLSCSSGVCDCNRNYYDRKFDCRNSSFVLGVCAIDLDCRSSLFQCNLGKCALKSVSLEENSLNYSIEEVKPSTVKKVLLFGDDNLSCANDDDCLDMANSLCDISNRMCGCNEETHYLYNGNCVQGLSRCESDNDCSGTNNTMCFKNSCICQKGFFLKDKKCIAELGMKDPHTDYETDSDCLIKPGNLINSVCYCKTYWFNDDANRNCIKTMIQSTLNCLTNEWCAAMGPYSFCNSTSNTCQCSSIAEFNEESYYCEKVLDDTDICLRDSDCSLNEHCLDEKCECLEDFSRNEDNICLPNIGASCAVNSCSHMKNSHCVGRICTCDSDYIGKKDKCLQMADYLGAPCEEQEQCQNIDHSVCGESDAEYDVTPDYNTTRCVCEEGFTDINEMCYQTRRYGDPCMTETDCTLVLNRSYKCRNSICQCDVGHSLKNGYCTSGGNILLASSLFWLAVLVMIGLF